MSADTKMRPDVRSEVVSNLKRDYSFKDVGDWLRRGKCPSCGSMELYVHTGSPWVVKCGRENKCGWTASTRDLYPDAFGKFNERFPATTQDPNATADAFMTFVRGFDPKRIRGWYRQGRFSHPKGDRTTATVVFDIDRENGVFMERLVEPVRVKQADGTIEVRKANFEGKLAGWYWMPPGQTVTDGELWLAEGCLDAIALKMHGLQAATTLSSNFFPTKLLEKLDPKKVTLVWALDNDRAGNTYTRKHIKAAKELGFECRAAVIPQKGKGKTDWNDAHLAGELEEEHLAAYRFHGDLLISESAREKGCLIWDRTGSTGFAVEFKSQTYWFAIEPVLHTKQAQELKDTVGYVPPRDMGDPERSLSFDAAMKVAKVEKIANRAFKFLYFQRNVQTDESWYYTRVESPAGDSVKSTFTSAHLKSASEFYARLLHISRGGMYTGNTGQLKWILGKFLDGIKEVQTVDFVGYSPEHKAWIFPTKAVSGGMAYDLNDEDFFEIGKTSVKSLNSSLPLVIGRREDYDKTWITHVHTAFGAKGIIAAAYYLGSLFAEHIRGIQESFPFLEIVGEAGAGKSTLIEFLWKLVGRDDYEGFDPNKSTVAARARIMSQVSNLPVCMIESDRGGGDGDAKVRQFDWDELKTAFNGRPSRATGVKNNGNDTKEPPFRGSIIISQNDKIDGSEAIMTRIVHTFHTTEHHSDLGQKSADYMAAIPVERVSNFLLMATQAEAEIMKLVAERAPLYEAEIRKDCEIRKRRIAKCHGQMMALVDALDMLVDLDDDVYEETQRTLKDCARERQRSIAANHPLVDEFWEIVEFVGLDELNHSKDDALICINMPEFASKAARKNLSVPPMSDLKRLLKGSLKPKFIDSNRAVNSRITETAIKCWRFGTSGTGTSNG